MPIYEYTCPQCKGRFQKLVRGFSDPPGLACPRCGNNAVKRAVSRVVTLKSEDAKIDALADPATFSGLDENDPKSIARWAKKLGKELGEDAGDDWNDMVDQMLEEEMEGGEGGSGAGKQDGYDNLGWG
jgi:putative regulatory protein, FmdB family